MTNLTSLNAVVLSISCVTFNSDIHILRETLGSLADSCRIAFKQEILSEVNLYIIDNGSESSNLEAVKQLRLMLLPDFTNIILMTGQGNIGYGRGHNLSIEKISSDYHIVINPDVIVAPENICEAIYYMNQHPVVGLLAPDALDKNGKRQYIAKRQPTIFVLLARAINFRLVNKYFVKPLSLYEYRDLIPAIAPFDVDFASGCFMFFRSNTLKKVGGFDSRFFMYFEDFDLTRRIKKIATVRHHPKMKIVHFGGGASKKGIKHIFYFFCSFIRFTFNKNT